jgi:hypothetical protein
VDRVIRTPTIAFFDLHAQLEPTTSRALPRMFLKTLIARLIDWEGGRVDHIYFVVDECQETLERSWITPLKQARSLGLSFVLVCQNLSDLKRGDVDLTDPVLGNCAVKVFTTIEDERSRTFLERTGGEKIVKMFSQLTSVSESEQGKSTTEGKSEQERDKPLFDQNTVNRINAHRYAVLSASPVSGYTRFEGPIILDIPFSMSEEEFNSLDTEEWPEPDGIRTVRASDLPPDPDDAPPAPTPRPSSPPPTTDGAPKKRRRLPKPISPEERQRVEQLREQLRQLRRGPKPT